MFDVFGLLFMSVEDLILSRKNRIKNVQDN